MLCGVFINCFDDSRRKFMRKPLYNIVIFIFHIITLILLFTLCIHFNVIKLDLLDFSKEAVASFFKNDYVVNIVCTILTAAALYIIQIKYSKHKLKSDFRCNEIIHDVYDGIERTHELIKESKELSNEIEELEKDPNMDFNVYRKEEALKYLAFYKKHKGDFKICNIALTYWSCCGRPGMRSRTKKSHPCWAANRKSPFAWIPSVTAILPQISAR